MGRGLSDLQRFILAQAGQRSRVYYPDVLAGSYGWKPVRPVRRYRAGDKVGYPEARPAPPEEVGTPCVPSSWVLSLRRLGRARYRSELREMAQTLCRYERVIWEIRDQSSFQRDVSPHLQPSGDYPRQ
jgi:hypothetical protein